MQIEQAVSEVQIGDKIMPYKQHNIWDEIVDMWLTPNEAVFEEIREQKNIEAMKKRWDKSAEKEQTGDSMGTINITSSIGRYVSVKEQERNMSITKVIFNDPATIVFWADGTKTVVQAYNEPFDKEKGLAMAIAKKALGNKGNYNEVFKKWIGEDK